MPIEKDIEILSDAAHGHSVTFGFDFYHACKMGYEALKRLEQSRKEQGIYWVGLLPGETKD